MAKKLLHKLHQTDGQILVWFALSLGIFILFCALAVDMGMIYLTKARLANSVDAAVLTAAKNYGLGQTTAQNLGVDMFQANYGSSAPTLTWTWCNGTPACNGVISATLHASTNYHTAFMQYLPNLTFWTIGDTAAAQRSTLVMMLVLDRSGSMSSDGGGTALQSAVPQFVADFTNGSDYVGMVSFASHSSIDVPITQQFQTAIDNKVSAFSFTGATFGTGAGPGTVLSTTNGPPITMADTQLNSVTLPNGTPEVKVMVYFTDGLMNSVQDQLTCNGNLITINFGGADPTSPDEASPYPPATVYSLNPTAEIATTYYSYCASGCTRNDTLPMYNNQSQLCKYNVNQEGVFYSQHMGTTEPMTRYWVTDDADYRAKYTAKHMQQESIPTYIYTIGLGNAVSGDVCTKALLATIANDPAAPSYVGAHCPAGTYDNTLPEGQLFIIAGCPGTQCTQELNAAFQTIASQVSLRLTQ